MSTRIQRSSVHRGVIILCLLGVLTISVLILLAIIVGVGDFETSRVLSAHFDDNRLKATRASQYQALGKISNSTVLTDFSVASLFSYTALIALIIIVCLGLTWFQRLSQTCAIAQKRAQDLESTLRHIDQGVIMVDTHGEIVVMNEKVGALLELPKPLDSRRRQFNELIEYMLKRGEFGTMTRASSQAAMHQIRSLAPGLTQDYYERKRPDGTVLAVQSNRMPEGGFVRTIKDITEHHRSTEKIAHLSAHDPLTNLENRKMFQEKLALTLKKTALEIGLSVLIIDLDEFKIVNDSHGHAIGDALLRLVALRLRSAVRSGDSIARLGGDEFAILLPGLSDPKLALARAQHLIEVLREPYRVGDLLLTSTASIGCAIAPQNGESAEDLVQNADIALHSAKADGRNARRLFAPEMAQQLVKRRRIEEELASALVNDELELHYQPLVNLNSGKCCGCEALLRWNHPQRGRIPPLDFIPIAEDTGLILPIGRWVLRQACREAADWPDQFRIAVNLSPIQFREPTLVEDVQSILVATGLDPSRLELEITETVMMQSGDQTVAKLKKLKALGVKISMDDFGTGYSSLNYLRNFAFDKIKIDRSFINELGRDNESDSIIRAIISLADCLGVSTTAEGVETLEQLEALRLMGCQEAQGYFFSPPRPVIELGHFLKKTGDQYLAITAA